MNILTRRDFFGERRFTLRRISSRLKAILSGLGAATRLSVRSAIGRGSLTGDTNVVVSLTSHGQRLRRVHLVIEAIGRGSAKPRELVLWIDPGVSIDKLPSALRRAERRGLSIRVSPDFFGPHTKYFPQALRMVEDSDLQNVDLVTADDDIIYPRDWLAKLMASDTKDGSLITCYRAHQIVLNGEQVAPYSQWNRVRTTEPSILNFATGVMGVRYPSPFVRYLAERGPQFVESCKNADDIWLHVSALRTGRMIQQIQNFPQEFPFVAGSQKDSLVAHNAFDGGNDQQIQATYTREDVTILSHVSASADEGQE